MKVLLSMANNSTTPYFNRFLKEVKETQDVELIFLCLYPTKPQMIDDMASCGHQCYWVEYDTKHRKMGLIKAFFKIFSLLRRIKPDVVHGHLFDDSFPLLLASWILRIKGRVISKLDAGYHYEFTPQWVKFDRFNNIMATHIIAVSGENKEFIIRREGAKTSKIWLVHQGLPIKELEGGNNDKKEELKKRFGLKGRRLVLTVARYIFWKGHRYIIEAAEKLVKEDPNVLFLFFGYGDGKEKVITEIKEKSLEDHVHVYGWIDREDLNNLYELAEVYVHAATQEPFGFVIAEAMLKKVPLVTTKTGAAYDAIDHMESGYIVNKGNSDEIKEGIQYIFNNDTTAWTNKAYEDALHRFIVEKMWRGHLNVYQHAVQ